MQCLSGGWEGAKGVASPSPIPNIIAHSWQEALASGIACLEGGPGGCIPSSPISTHLRPRRIMRLVIHDSKLAQAPQGRSDHAGLLTHL